MSLEHVPKGKFNICMTCRNVVKKRMLGTGRWFVRCEMNIFSCEWHDATRFDEPDVHEQNFCPYYAERMMESFNEKEQ